MDRIVDANQFVAEGAVVDWETAAALHDRALAAAQRHARTNVAGPRSLQLRWYVSKTAGVPPVPFTVWLRRDKDSLTPLDVRGIRDGADTWVLWEGAPLLTLEVTCQPVDATRPCAVWGFRTDAKATSAVAVSEARTGPGPFRLTVRAGALTYARVVNATVTAARAVRATDVATNGAWEELEFVGLPYDPGQWPGAIYDGEKQGLVSALVPPFDAAVERLVRAAPPLGWFPVTGTGHLAPDWKAPDFPELVRSIQKQLLTQIGALFEPGVDPATQAALRDRRDVRPPSQDGRVATVPSSTAVVPVLGALLMAANTDPFTALGAGFGTGYPLDDRNERLFGRDLMVTATYPKGLGPFGELEYAWIVPAQAPHHAMTPPIGLDAQRSGLLDPLTRNRPWRETVRLSWDAMARSFLLGRAAGAAAARYVPADTATRATSLLEEREAGGPVPLAPVRRPKPFQDRVAVVDASRDLPVDGSVLSTGYAVAQQDPFGVWSPWEDVTHDGAEPDQPVPVIGEVHLDTTYAGTAQCPATMSIVVIADWSARTPSFLQVAVVIAPVPFPGAATPVGVTPFGPPPAGGTRQTITVQFMGDTANSLTPGTTVVALDGAEDTVVPFGPGQGERRRYRLDISGQTLDFAPTPHYVALAWAREVAAGRPAFGATSPQPMRAFASSPVPVLVPFVPLPIVPLGSLVDAEGRSHVSLRLGGLPGAVKLVVWTATETRIRRLAGQSAIPADRSLSERFVELKAAFAALAPAARREAFGRVRELPGPPPFPGSLDHALPKGSREIHLFTVTGVTAANVESPFPGHVDQFQAAAAPTPVRPGVPELSTAVVSEPGGNRVQVELSCHSTVAVVAFELHRTYLAPATASTGQMGPALASIAATPAGGPPTPAGLRYTATFVDSGAGDWRPARYRARAVPLLSTTDREHGLLAARSADSSTSTLLLTPAGAPDLLLGAVSRWGPGESGVLVTVTTDAPLDRHPLGAFTLDAAAAVSGGGSPVAALSSALDGVVGGSITSPPAAVGAGTLTRSARVAKRTTIALWFTRPSAQQAVDVTLRLTDPLGRVATVAVTVPGVAPHPAPQVSIVGVRQVGAAVAVTLRTNVGAEVGPAGASRIDVTVRRNAFPRAGASLQATFAQIPDVTDLPPNPPGQLVLAGNRARRGEYVLLVRVTRPLRLRVGVTDGEGQTAAADRTLGAGPL